MRQQEFFEQAFTHMRSGDPELAAKVSKDALSEFPEDPNLLCIAARAHIALQRFKEARTDLEKAKSLYPDFAIAHETIADLNLIQGLYEEAIESYQTAIELDPGRSDTHIKISRARELKEISEPVKGRRRQQMAFADEIEKAAMFERGGEPAKAEKIYRQILKRDPDHVEAMRLLAVVATNHRRFRDAEVFLSRAVSLAPDYARAWLDLSNVQSEQDKHKDSIESAQHVVRLTPEIAESHIALANSLGRAGQQEEAIEAYQEALKISESHPGALSGLAHQLKTIGKQDEAIEVHRRNLAANPGNAEPYWSMANLKTVSFTDEELDNMVSLLEEGNLDDLTKQQLCNAMGLEYERREDYNRAFSCFETCNESRRAVEAYDPVETETTTSELIEFFNKEYLAENTGKGVMDSAPIFIVGLPRSGSTLIEQILASHSQVEGTHELSDLPWVVRYITQPGRYPNALKKLNTPAWTKIGNEYLNRTQQYRTGVPHFIDKNPNNFVHCGLLRLALPNAKIINAKRHPMDSCFGSYKQLFASGQPFSYDLMELGEYYVQYERIMDHWHEVIPDQVLDVNYEEVVADLEGQVQRILDYCGLEFEEACVRFHETERAVKTASSEQVRLPIYSTSVNLWRNYEEYLDELIEVLEPIIRERPQEDWPSVWK